MYHRQPHAAAAHTQAAANWKKEKKYFFPSASASPPYPVCFPSWL